MAGGGEVVHLVVPEDTGRLGGDHGSQTKEEKHSKETKDG